MSATIIKHEFLSRMRSVIIWSLSAATLILFYFSFFSVFSDQAELMNQLLSKFPPQVSAAFGMNNMDLTSALGYYSFIFVFVQLCLAIQAGNYGFSLVSIEETELTADFLMTKPVSRFQVLNSKLLAAICSLALTNAVVWASSFIVLQLFTGDHPYELKNFLLLLGSIAIFQLFFLAVGLVISLLVKRVRSVTPYALGLAFGMYVLNAMNGIFDEVAIEWITPFKHFDAPAIANSGQYDSRLVLFNVTISLVALGVSYWLYQQRDIHAVS